MDEQYITLDGIKWHVQYLSAEYTKPLCPKHHLTLSLVLNNPHACWLKCQECNENYTLPREYNIQKSYIIDKLNSKEFKKMKFLNLDDEAIPIAEDRADSKDDKYFVRAILTESKVGQRLVVYAGEKGKKDKTQIFVEPEIRRLAFDQKDLHPSDVFLSLEGTFEDGTKSTITKSNKKKD
ncbi:MAG: hypothetical protein WC735_01980 [Candidatus Paceibacterota bacterium]|jgi:hypothetical protein